MELSKFRHEKLYDSLNPRARQAAMCFSLFMTLVFFLAVAGFAGVRANDAANSPAAMVMTSTPVSSMALPALTVCPMFPQSVINATECVFEQGATVVSNCLSQVIHFSMVIEGTTLACLQYNNVPASPFLATSSSSELGTRTLVDFSRVPLGEPLGVYVIVHQQGVAPPFTWNNVFIGDPGDVTLALLQNTTLVYANGSSVVNFGVSISKAATAANDTASLNTVDIDVIYPQMIAFTNSQVPIYIQHEWIGEVGGLAALLYFLHQTIMWIVLVVLYCLGCVSSSKGMAYQTEQDS